MSILRRAIFALISVAAVVGFIGVFPANAEGPVLHLYVCRFEAGGLWDDPLCTTKANQLQVYNKVGMSSTPQEVKSKGEKFELESTIGVTPVLIACTAQTGPGTGWNPEPFATSNGQGAAKALTYESCTVSKPAGCEIPGKKVVTKELQAVIEESKTLGVGAKFTPSGETFAEITLEKCSTSEFSKKYVVKGSDFGIAHKDQLEFTNASSSLTFGGAKAQLRGLSTVTDPSGNSVLALP
ncbi:MAG TPA: hypothetical protein VJQ84_07305 [Solirubrobacterales bacterium]|nr:hypothetical protein [Solirubrobacterales bacterium]